jgi:hypothetical protein
MEKNILEESQKLINEAFAKYKAGDFDFENVPLEDRLDLEAAFRLVDPEMDFKNSGLVKFRTKNLISIGF